MAPITVLDIITVGRATMAITVRDIDLLITAAIMARVIMDMVDRAIIALTATGKPFGRPARRGSKRLLRALWRMAIPEELSPCRTARRTRCDKLIPFRRADFFYHGFIVAFAFTPKFRLVLAKLNDVLLDIGARREYRIFFHSFSLVVVSPLRLSERFPSDCGVITAT